MSKKWLYSVAVGALLIAGEALGITVQEVLSNGFWNGDSRGLSRGNVNKEILWASKRKNFKKTVSTWQETPEYGKGLLKTFTLGKDKVGHRRWKIIREDKLIIYTTPQEECRFINSIFDLRTPLSRQKQNVIAYQKKWDYMPAINDYITSTNVIDTTYTCKPKKGRPVGPYTENWTHQEFVCIDTCNFTILNTEHNAITNIISDNEAYISGSVYQTGTYDSILGLETGWPIWMDRAYTQHILTSNDVVYISQNISVQSSSYENEERTYYTDYTATFKNGKCKGETESISCVQKAKYRNEYIEFLKRFRAEQNTR